MPLGSEQIRKRRISPSRSWRRRCPHRAVNPQLNASSPFLATGASAARKAERLVMRRGKLPPLFGVPVSVKDIVFTTETPTTAGSKIFGDGLIADQDAPVVRRLRRAGAIIIGKTNLHEVALGVTSANEHFGPVRNPHDPERVAGGSSGGSAVAVATGMGPLSVGSDTRGSIRILPRAAGLRDSSQQGGSCRPMGSSAQSFTGPRGTDRAHGGRVRLMLEARTGSRYAGRFTRRRAGRPRACASACRVSPAGLDSAVQKPLDAAIGSSASWVAA